MTAPPTLAPDAALVLGIAATAIPFARTPEDEAERWLRVLRLHGEVGAALQALGVSEASLDDGGDPGEQQQGRGATAGERPAGDVISLVGDRATHVALERGASGVGTTELLIALLDVYGDVFERTLRAHGTDADEVFERLAVPRAA
ncbi:MAG: hypothetical protein JWM66_387 [Solirubrobacterales bacterium]|jgi:hypothetical protein|nr:hypothetical protein [Solirubrobacterales bacterium]